MATPISTIAICKTDTTTEIARLVITPSCAIGLYKIHVYTPTHQDVPIITYNITSNHNRYRICNSHDPELSWESFNSLEHVVAKITQIVKDGL